MTNDELLINILKKYFDIKIEFAFDEYYMIHIQAWSDLDTYDTSAYEVIKDINEIEFLKKVLNN